MGKQDGPVRVEVVSFGPKYFVMLDGKSVGGSCDNATVAKSSAAAINAAIEAKGRQEYTLGWNVGFKESRRKAFDEAILALCSKPGCVNDSYANDIRKKLEQLKEHGDEG